MSSGSVHRRSRGDSSGSDGERGSEISVADREKVHRRKKRRGFGRFGVGVRKGKKALFFRLRKFRKLFKSSLSSDSSINSGSRKDSGWFSGGKCCACFSKPYNVNEDDESQGNVVPDDPEEFSYEHLKSMIEKNDFYSKECDTHLDDD